MRGLKIAGWIVAAVVLIVAGGVAALWFGGGPLVAWALEHPVSSAIGRQIRVAGPLTIEWGSPTRIVAENVHLANAGWGSAPEMFSAARIEADFFPGTLLWGTLKVQQVALDNAELLLETSKSGERNWDLALKHAAPQNRHQFPDLQHLVLRHSDLTYRNGGTGAVTALGLATLEVNAPDPSQPVTIAAAGTFQHQPMRLNATVGPLAQLRDTAKPYPVSVDGALDQIRLAAVGTLQEPLDVAGADLRLSLSGTKLDQLATVLGVPMPELPDFRATAKLRGGNGKWAMDALTIKLGKSDLEGGIAIDTTSTVPRLKAQLTSTYIDLADFKGVYGGTPAQRSAPTTSTAAPGRVLPDTQIEVKKFPGIDADLTFDATRIKSSGGIPFERISLGLRLDKGVLRVEPLRFRVAGGDVDLNLHYTPFTKQGPPQLQANIDIRHVDLHQLLGGPTMPEALKRTAGIAGGFAKIDTNGTSISDFLGRMNGDAGLFMENGKISDLLQQLAPIDVLGVLGVYVSGDKPVPINCVISRFDIKNGVMTPSTLLVDTADTVITAKGNINFASEALDLTVTPSNKKLTMVSLRSPVHVEGTFAKPSFHVEAGELIARVAAAVGLGVVFPPAALLPLVDTGLGPQNACASSFAASAKGGTE